MPPGRPRNPTSILPPGQQPIPYLQLRDYRTSLKHIHQEVTVNRDSCFQWLARMGLIANTMKCRRGNCNLIVNPQDPNDTGNPMSYKQRSKNVQDGKVVMFFFYFFMQSPIPHVLVEMQFVRFREDNSNRFIFQSI